MAHRKNSGKSAKNMIKVDNIYMELKEILREHALRYLPAKSLYRSCSVCRDWKLQISTPFFVHNQSVSFRSISGAFYQSPQGSPSFLSFDSMAYGVPDPELKFLPEPVNVKSSCNGLLCCQGQTGDKAYYVCNPANQQWKKLPKPAADHGPSSAPIIVFEPSVLNFLAEYKVVCIFSSSDFDEAYEFEVYSSAQESWKVCGEMHFSKTSLSFKTGISVNNVAYWPTSSGMIMSFDLKKQQAKLLYGYYYYGYGGGRQDLSLGQVNGQLCRASMNGLSLTVNVLQTTFANTMPMNSRTRPWEPKHQVQLKSADVQFDASSKPCVLLTWDNEILFHIGGTAYIHNLKTCTTTTLSSKGDFNSSCVILPYVNSLVSLI